MHCPLAACCASMCGSTRPPYDVASWRAHVKCPGCAASEPHTTQWSSSGACREAAGGAYIPPSATNKGYEPDAQHVEPVVERTREVVDGGTSGTGGAGGDGGMSGTGGAGGAHAGGGDAAVMRARFRWRWSRCSASLLVVHVAPVAVSTTMSLRRALQMPATVSRALWPMQRGQASERANQLDTAIASAALSLAPAGARCAIRRRERVRARGAQRPRRTLLRPRRAVRCRGESASRR